MSDNDKRRVLIVGGGIAGLTAAYELSRTPDLRARWDVEVVEMGHRFGGRLASAHNPHRWGRNEEHGLHVWFGWYDNAFRLAEQVWADAPIPADCPWKSVWDAFRPIYHSDHGIVQGDEYVLRRAYFVRNADRPGTTELPSIDTIVAAMTDFPRAAIWTVLSILGGRELSPPGPGLWKMRPQRRLSRLATAMLRALPTDLSGGARTRVAAARRASATMARFHRPLVAAALRVAGRDAARRDLVYMLDLAIAVCRGMGSAEHEILWDGDFDRVSDWELRDWLRHHGLSEESSAKSRFVHALYDIPFAFEEGDVARPVMEASTGLRYSFRIVFNYKHAPAYLFRGGAGETLIAPVCALLRERGVRLTPFHRLDSVAIEGGRLGELRFVRAARASGEYDTLVERRGFLSTRHEPDWSKIEDGAALRDRGVDFYSRFGDQGEHDEVVRRVGTDYDDVILALPLGCIKPDGDGHTPVAAWLRHHPPARACIERLHLVPTVAAQVWLKDEVPSFRDRAAVTWAEPFSVVSDMTPVIEHESWSGEAPGCCAYLCGPAPLGAPRAASTSHGTKEADLKWATKKLQEGLDRHGHGLFGEGFRSHTVDGEDVRYVRVNVEPWDLADLPLPGADRVRLEATDTGLDNLAICGTWVRNTTNSTSVEAAVSTGIAAARALGASTQLVLSEGLFRKAPEEATLPGRGDIDVASARG